MVLLCGEVVAVLMHKKCCGPRCCIIWSCWFHEKASIEGQSACCGLLGAAEVPSYRLVVLTSTRLRRGCAIMLRCAYSLSPSRVSPLVVVVGYDTCS
jgi:hypothetical protein